MRNHLLGPQNLFSVRQTSPLEHGKLFFQRPHDDLRTSLSLGPVPFSLLKASVLKRLKRAVLDPSQFGWFSITVHPGLHSNSVT